ncbi:MAG: lmo0937 family membrane protein [Maribacter sp.]
MDLVSKSTGYRVSKLIYATIVISLICWAIGFFLYSIGAIIHWLLVVAVMAAIVKVIKD